MRNAPCLIISLKLCALMPIVFLFNNENSIESIKLLLESGFDVNHKDESGLSPLHISVNKNSVEIGKLLLDNNSDPVTSYSHVDDQPSHP